MSQADTDPIEHNKDLNAQSFDQKPRQRDNVIHFCSYLLSKFMHIWAN